MNNQIQSEWPNFRLFLNGEWSPNRQNANRQMANENSILANPHTY